MSQDERFMVVVFGALFLGALIGSVGAWLSKQKRPPMTFKVELGTKVRDRVTALEGKVIGRSEWLYGCRRYVVQPLELKDGRPVEVCHFDEDQLELLDAGIPNTVKDTGGPRETEARRF